MKTKCKHEMQYEADAGTPGFGKFYTCSKCGRKFWSSNGRDFTAVENMHPEDCIMDVSWVI
jgi:uncharacterized protein with PIN domain